MKPLRRHFRSQRGFSLLELLIATSILGTMGVAVLLGLTTGIAGSQRVSQGRAALDVAQSQIEYIKTQSFAASYALLPSSELPDGINQSDINIEVKKTDRSGDADGTETVQLIIVTVSYDGGNRSVVLEGYKTDREYS